MNKISILKLTLAMSSLGLILLSVACNNGSTTSSTSSPTPSINTPPPWTPPIVLEPVAPPEGAYVLPGGLRNIPSVASPWPDVPVILSPSFIQVKNGDEFSIGLDMSSQLGNSWSANFDTNVLSLMEEKVVTFDPSHILGTCWFRFKAIGRDFSYTTITFDYGGGISGGLMARLQYVINVTSKE